MDFLIPLLPGLLSPMVLAFLLGIVATLLRSDLQIPEPLHAALTIYLLFAIGLKGGAKLDGVNPADFAGPLCAALALCAAIPVWSYHLLRRLGRLDAVNAGALAAHYGSVSVVTFGACVAFLEARQAAPEPFLPALLAVMEVPGILVALWLVRRAQPAPAAVPAGALGFVPNTRPGDWTRVVHELLTSKGIVLLLGGMTIGLVTGRKGFEQVAPLFDTPFRGVLMLFLLEIGLVTGRRLRDLRAAGAFLCGFAVVMPLLHGLLGVALGTWSGLGAGGAAALGTLAASASYIAAPAAVRVALPAANPALYLTASLAITFPCNVVVGIPVYFAFARWLA
ncbi:MAG: sodium-dependent bicarbonate transport family permease [Verrucomicrobiota bacterium]